MSQITIKSIEIVGMHNVSRKTYNLNQITYLAGRNGSGKTTVLNAIQLALLGYIPGEAQKNEAIFRHANGPVMSVKLTLSNGVTVQRQWTQQKKSISSFTAITPDGYDLKALVSEIELPVFNFSEFMSLSANKMKEWFVQFLPNSATEVNWKEELTKALESAGVQLDDSLTEQIGELVKQAAEISESGVEKVIQMNTYIKELISFTKGQIAAKEATLRSLVEYEDAGTDSAEDLEKQIESCRSQLNSLQTLKADVETFIRVSQSNKATKAQLEQYADLDVPFDQHPGVVAAQKTEADSLEALKVLQPKIEDMKSQLRSMVEASAPLANVIRGGSVCPFTKTECATVAKNVENTRKEYQSLRDEFNKLKAVSDAACAEADKLTDAINAARQQISAVQTRYKVRDSLLSSLTEVVDPGTPAEVVELRIQEANAQMKALSDRLIKVRANEQFQQMFGTVNSEKARLAKDLEAFKVWEKLTGANGLQTRISSQAFMDFGKKMDKYLKKMFANDDYVSCTFDLSEKANSFSFGISRVNKDTGLCYIPYENLSSGEKAMYMLALLLCLTECSASDLKLLMVDDVLDHVDSTNVKELFAAINSVKDAQIILAGVVPYPANMNRSEVVIAIK